MSSAVVRAGQGRDVAANSYKALVTPTRPMPTRPMPAATFRAGHNGAVGAIMVEVAEADPAAEADPVRTAVVAACGGEELGDTTTAQRQGVRPAGQQAEGGGGPVRHYPEKLGLCALVHTSSSAPRVVVDPALRPPCAQRLAAEACRWELARSQQELRQWRATLRVNFR